MGWDVVRRQSAGSSSGKVKRVGAQQAGFAVHGGEVDRPAAFPSATGPGSRKRFVYLQDRVLPYLNSWAMERVSSRLIIRIVPRCQWQVFSENHCKPESRVVVIAVSSLSDSRVFRRAPSEHRCFVRWHDEANVSSAQDSRCPLMVAPGARLGSWSERPCRPRTLRV